MEDGESEDSSTGKGSKSSTLSHSSCAGRGEEDCDVNMRIVGVCGVGVCIVGDGGVGGGVLVVVVVVAA